MKRKIFLLVAVCWAFADLSAHAADEALRTSVIVKKGQEVFIRLSYDGSIKGWDASIDYHKGVIATGNAGFITVTDSKGNAVAPRENKLKSSWRNTVLEKAFDARVNLSAVYDVSKLGDYVVEWGCKNVQTHFIRIEVVE